MNKQPAPFSWSRLLLWSHVFGIIAFYLILWFRTNPRTGRAATPAAHGNKVGTATLSGGDTLSGGEVIIARPPVKVSIIVPARNEQRNIERCVTSLLEQDYASYEVIVVDDDSTDDTPDLLDDIARHHPHGDKLWVLRIKDLPLGWAGKPHALHAGVQEAHGDWLLFTDADTWHAPNALRTALVRATDEEIDLYTLGAKQELPGFWNKIMMPVAYLGISMQYPIAKVNDPTSSIAIANGQYILIRRSVYDIIGGYARPDLRNTLLDDRDLARVVKENGFRLRMEDGRDLVHVHMYSNLRTTWRGWRKNAYIGSRGGLFFVLLELIGLPMVAIVPFILPFLAWFARRTPARSGRVTPAELSLASVLELSSVLSYRRWLDHNLDIPWYYAFTYPLAAALFTGILGESAWRVLTHKGVDWSGRIYYAAAEKETRDRERQDSLTG
jgi:chlorobactene glucosyltransferase